MMFDAFCKRHNLIHILLGGINRRKAKMFENK